MNLPLEVRLLFWGLLGEATSLSCSCLHLLQHLIVFFLLGLHLRESILLGMLVELFILALQSFKAALDTSTIEIM